MDKKYEKLVIIIIIIIIIISRAPCAREARASGAPWLR